MKGLIIYLHRTKGLEVEEYLLFYVDLGMFLQEQAPYKYAPGVDVVCDLQIKFYTHNKKDIYPQIRMHVCVCVYVCVCVCVCVLHI